MYTYHACTNLSVWFSTTAPDIKLSTRDLANLYTVLSGAAVRWLDIGLQLGIHIDDLDAIKASPLLLYEGVRGFFRAMLKEWLQWTPPHHPYPTLEALISALKTPCVGEFRLASELKEKFLELQGKYCRVSITVQHFLCRKSLPFFTR